MHQSNHNHAVLANVHFRWATPQKNIRNTVVQYNTEVWSNSNINPKNLV